MTTKFELTLIVPAKLVGAVVELMEGEGVLVSMKPHNHKITRSSPIHRHHVPGKTADSVMDDFIRSVKGTFTVKDVEKEFAKYGYATGTVSSRLSMAKHTKRIKSVGNPRSGLYEKA